MKFINEFVNAAQLFTLLCLVFWSFTWNSPTDHGSRHPKPKNTKQVTASEEKTSAIRYQKLYLIDALSPVKYVTSRVSSERDKRLPPFYEWKEKEKTKYEKGSVEVASSGPRNPSRRKLNYSSSKCGAKILASNRESKHKTAILNEKADEYMLNPCRVRTWFIIELCDTVEATQIELANYELYSSFPREFSVSWSDVYPTVVWHLLGNFEAKDDRTMQVFELNTKNLGKFIKVVIFNHHGKEHYCPLSVIRILGYSMVQEFEAIEDEKNNPVSSVPRGRKATDNEAISVSRNKPNPRDHAVVRQMNSDIPALNFLELCPISDVCLTRSNGKCVNNPLCRFLHTVMMKQPSVFCGFNISSNISETDYEAAKFSSNGTADGNSSLVNLTNDRIIIAENNQNRRMSEYSNISKNNYSKTVAGEDSKNAVSGGYIDSRMHKASTVVNNFTNASAVGDSVSVADEFVKKTEYELKNTCSCDSGGIKVPASQREFKAFKDNAKATEVESAEDSVDSAGLIQKESVLIKLTSRIRTTEMDLNLINKYLQQLSQSYRSQMEDMKIMFDQTVRAVAVASEEAAAIDKKQQYVMTRLEEKIITLGEKIQYQGNGQRHLLQRVVELHGFFLILEIIVISTICTIFLNMFNRLKLSVGDSRSNSVKLGP